MYSVEETKAYVKKLVEEHGRVARVAAEMVQQDDGISAEDKGRLASVFLAGNKILRDAVEMLAQSGQIEVAIPRIQEGIGHMNEVIAKLTQRQVEAAKKAHQKAGGYLN